MARTRKAHSPRKKLILFDLDGTLYRLPGGSYSRSPLRHRVRHRAILFLASRLQRTYRDASRLLREIEKEFGEHISIGFEKVYDFNRYEYFNWVWDVSLRGIIKKDPTLRPMLKNLQKHYATVLATDAPQVWIEKVLRQLNIADLFSHAVNSGEGDQRKGSPRKFAAVARHYGYTPNQCIVVGDQEKSDILPAKKLGMLTVRIRHSKKISSAADAIIPSIHSLPKILKMLEKKKRPISRR